MFSLRHESKEFFTIKLIKIFREIEKARDYNNKMQEKWYNESRRIVVSVSDFPYISRIFEGLEFWRYVSGFPICLKNHNLEECFYSQSYGEFSEILQFSLFSLPVFKKRWII